MAILHPDTVRKVQQVLYTAKGGKGDARARFNSGKPGTPDSRPGYTSGKPGTPDRKLGERYTSGKPGTPDKHTSSGASTPGPAAAPGAKPAPAAPFLNPAQQKAVIDYDTTYGYNMGASQRKVSDATYDTNQGLYNNARQHDVASDNANQTMAARGLFQSSIRAADLNDIDATLTMRNNILNTNLHRLMIDEGANQGRLTTNWSAFHNYYNTLAVANAQAIPPATQNPAGGGAGAPGAPGTGYSSGAKGTPDKPAGYSSGASGKGDKRLGFSSGAKGHGDPEAVWASGSITGVADPLKAATGKPGVKY